LELGAQFIQFWSLELNSTCKVFYKPFFLNIFFSFFICWLFSKIIIHAFPPIFFLNFFFFFKIDVFFVHFVCFLFHFFRIIFYLFIFSIRFFSIGKNKIFFFCCCFVLCHDY
jgi:hypothetical protein